MVQDPDHARRTVGVLHDSKDKGNVDVIVCMGSTAHIYVCSSGLQDGSRQSLPRQGAEHRVPDPSQDSQNPDHRLARLSDAVHFS